jgi:hypothetical protein
VGNHGMGHAVVVNRSLWGCVRVPPTSCLQLRPPKHSGGDLVGKLPCCNLASSPVFLASIMGGAKLYVQAS